MKKDLIKGIKFDNGKRRWSLLPWRELGAVIDVLTTGAKKYSDNNWKYVEDGKNRYYDALMRHLTAWWDGEKNDPEDGLHHLAHAICNILFLFWMDNEGV